jgi:iron complex transport system permease protein
VTTARLDVGDEAQSDRRSAVPGSAGEPDAGGRLRIELRSTRVVVTVAAGIALIALVAAWYLSRGEPNVGIDVVWRAIVWSGDPSDPAAIAIRELRLPRVTLAIAAGAALGVAGVIMQDSLRNPIADPSLLGISQAAALVVAILLLFPGALPEVSTPLLTLAAGLVTGIILVLLARSIRDPVRLIIVGVVLGLLYTSLTSVALLLAPPGSGGLSRFFTFTTGSVSSASWQRLDGIWPWLIVAFPLGLLCGRVLNVLQLGDDVASGLGMRVTRARLALLSIAVLLVAPVVAVAGPIAFVAFLSPHVARSLLRSSNAHGVLPTAAVVGALVVLLADSIGRLLFFPLEIPAGIWTIVVAGPIAIWFAGSALRRGSDGPAGG